MEPTNAELIVSAILAIGVIAFAIRFAIAEMPSRKERVTDWYGWNTVWTGHCYEKRHTWFE